MRVNSNNHLCSCFRCRLANELRFFNGSHGLLDEIPFVVDKGDIFFREITDLVVRNFPKLVRYLRDETEVMRDNHYTAFIILYSTSEGVNR
jgi:hypothetical protein